MLDTTQVTLTPREDHTFSVEALDEFDNPISGLIFTFRSAKQAGQVDNQGSFTAGTKAGIYTGAVTVEATQDTITKSASADVTVKQSYDTAVAIFKGELNTQTAFMTGKLKVSGNLAKLMMHQNVIQQWGAAVGDLDVDF